MDQLSPINYTMAVCQVSPIKALLSFCNTILLFLFGNDQTALAIALIMLVVDTITGSAYAIMIHDFKNKEFWRVIPKGIAILSAFIVGNLLSIFQPELGKIIAYGIASAIIIAEGTSILENVVKINPDTNLRKVLAKIKKL
jgi:phage-related holin